MASSRDHVLAFDVDWNDRVTGIVWRYQLKYYTETGEIEMVSLAYMREVQAVLGFREAVSSVSSSRLQTGSS